ncbi:hypothetical protein NPIL_633881 [Nephila pilipes]|uniref:Uncharacterized protein n=1 Tax=Nephila pilipes TaxID=299642 RepID=A0A8X6UHZ4_NEPPI|nr:hypothetical protein NPIL_633881 [Nephila pilipes]
MRGPLVHAKGQCLNLEKLLFLRKEFGELMSQDIRPSDSPFSSLIHCVKKNNGSCVILKNLVRRETVADFSVPFEDHLQALVDIRNNKIVECFPIIEELRKNGKPASGNTIVGGSLGTLDPANSTVLLKFGISRRFTLLMRILMCSDTICWSRDI